MFRNVVCGLLIWALALPAWANDAKIDRCQVLYRTIAKTVFLPNKQLWSDLDKVTDWLYWGRLDKALRAVDHEAFFKAFEQATPQDIADMYHYALSGYLKFKGRELNQREIQFLMDLYEFGITDSQGRGFWSGSTSETRLAKALEQLDAINKRRGYERDIGATAGFTAKAIGKTEARLIERAVNPNREKFPSQVKFMGIRFDGLRTFFFPLYPRVLKVLGFNNHLRKRIEHEVEVDQLVERISLQKKGELKFTAEELDALKFLIAKTSTSTREVRDESEAAYGVELSFHEGLPLKDIDIYKIFERIKGKNFAAERVEYQREGEKELDRCAQIIDAARGRLGKAPRTFAEFDLVERQFRHSQFARQARETSSAHHGALGRGGEMRITIYYEYEVQVPVTKTRTNSEGKTETYIEYKTETRNDSTSRNPTYSEILRGSIDTSPPKGRTTSVSGKSEILSRTKKLRTQEKPFWDRQENLESRLYDMINGHYEHGERPGTREELANKLDANNQALEAALKDLKTYANWGRQKIHGQFDRDRVRDFQARNSALVKRYENLITFNRLYAAQLRKGDTHVRFQYKEGPKYEKELAALKSQMRRDNWIKFISVATMVLGGGGAGYYVYQDDLFADANEDGEDPADLGYTGYDYRYDDY